MGCSSGAGAAQLILVAASLAIPRWLNWQRDLAKLRPLTRQVFWTYAGYIWVTNLSFGLVSTMRPLVLLDRSPLAGPLLVGLSLMIHFGAFDVVAGGWRWRGVGCQRLFRADRPRRLDRPRLDAGLAAGSPADLVPSAVPGRCGLAPRRGERVSQSFHRHAQVQAHKDMTNMTREWGW